MDRPLAAQFAVEDHAAGKPHGRQDIVDRFHRPLPRQMRCLGQNNRRRGHFCWAMTNLTQNGPEAAVASNRLKGGRGLVEQEE